MPSVQHQATNSPAFLSRRPSTLHFKSASYQRGFKVATPLSFEVTQKRMKTLPHGPCLCGRTTGRREPRLLRIASQWLPLKSVWIKGLAILKLYPVIKAPPASSNPLLSNRCCHQTGPRMIDGLNWPFRHCPALFIALKVYWWATVWYANTFGSACRGLTAIMLGSLQSQCDEREQRKGILMRTAGW